MAEGSFSRHYPSSTAAVWGGQQITPGEWGKGLVDRGRSAWAGGPTTGLFTVTIWRQGFGKESKAQRKLLQHFSCPFDSMPVLPFFPKKESSDDQCFQAADHKWCSAHCYQHQSIKRWDMPTPPRTYISGTQICTQLASSCQLHLSKSVTKLKTPGKSAKPSSQGTFSVVLIRWGCYIFNS